MLMDEFNIEGEFPVVLTSKKPILSHTAFLDVLAKNKALLNQLLLEKGALLFRDFPVNSASCFSNVIETLNFGNFVNYIGGDSPRDKVENKVYTSTEAPPNLHIPLHQELSFMKTFPRHIYFFCEIPPISGGETIIADARKVYKTLDEHVKQRFVDKGLTYISHYYHRSMIMNWVNRFQRSHKSWMEVFETSDKKEVEKKCQQNEFSWKWLFRNWLQVKQTRPALLTHPLTNETVWFNQAHLYDFNPRLLGWKRYIGAKLFYFRKTTRLHEITFADGSKVPRKDLYHILDTLQQNTVAFPWQKGDVLILDNVLAMHGRAPFSGKRRILTALTT